MGKSMRQRGGSRERKVRGDSSGLERRGGGVSFAGMKLFLTRWLITTIAVAVAANLTGMQYAGPGALITVALLLGIVNALVRPVLLLLSLPFILLSLGLFILVVNALLLWFVAGLVSGFHVAGFGQAFFGALIVSIVNWSLSVFLKTGDSHLKITTCRGNPRSQTLDEQPIKPVQGRVIE